MKSFELLKQQKEILEKQYQVLVELKGIITKAYIETKDQTVFQMLMNLQKQENELVGIDSSLDEMLKQPEAQETTSPNTSNFFQPVGKDINNSDKQNPKRDVFAEIMKARLDHVHDSMKKKL